MKDFMDKKEILDLKQGGASNREVSRKLGINLKTV
jgi:DNA-binding CsgD family transcriptional regulator